MTDEPYGQKELRAMLAERDTEILRLLEALNTANTDLSFYRWAHCGDPKCNSQLCIDWDEAHGYGNRATLSGEQP